MTQHSRSLSPFLIAVTGRPGSGKTTLSRRLAAELRCPAVCRDELKEGLVHSIDRGWPEPDRIQWHVYAAFFDTVGLLLRRGVSVIADAAFQHGLWSQKLEPLQAVARVKIVRCVVDPDVAHARSLERESSDPRWSHYHGAPPAPDRTYDPPRMNLPTIDVDTTDGYAPGLSRVVAFASG